MNRREFLQAGAAGLALSSATGGLAPAGADEKPKRVGLIGCGWYGKADLFRLIQVAPVEVVSLCDVDKRDARRGRRDGRRPPGVEKDPAHLRRLPRDARGERPRRRPDRHPRPLARPADDRRRRGRGRRLRAEADQHRRRRRRRPCSRRPGSTSGSSRSAPSGGARPTSSRPATASIREGLLGKVGLVEVYCYYHMRARGNPPDTNPPEYARLRDVDRPRADAAV